MDNNFEPLCRSNRSKGGQTMNKDQQLEGILIEISKLVERMLSLLSKRAKNKYPLSIDPELIRLASVLVETGKEAKRQIDDIQSK